MRVLHFPGVHPDAAAWLLREREINAIGIDTASIDYGQSTSFETHVAFLTKNVPVFENLADLRDLPALGFQVIALPMKIASGTGGPLRVIAYSRRYDASMRPAVDQELGKTIVGHPSMTSTASHGRPPL